MRTTLTVISDTHLPRRAKDLPAAVWASIEQTDVVVHAGDWCVPELLDELERRSPRVLGVYGNNDGAELRSRLPEVARAELGGLRVAVVHDSGPAAGPTWWRSVEARGLRHNPAEPVAPLLASTALQRISRTSTDPKARSKLEIEMHVI